MTTETITTTDNNMPKPSSPQTDRDATSPMQIDTAGLTQDLTAPAGPTSPHCAADAARAMHRVESWQPRLDRRQSWDSQEYKHMQQSAMQTQLEGENKPESGFTERG